MRVAPRRTAARLAPMHGSARARAMAERPGIVPFRDDAARAVAFEASPDERPADEGERHAHASDRADAGARVAGPPDCVPRRERSRRTLEPTRRSRATSVS